MMAASAARATAKPIRVVLADDHRLLRDALCAMLAHEPDLEVVGTASDGLEAVRLARELRPDVVVTDISMPGLNGLEAIRRINSEEPGVRTLCLSMHDSSRMVLAVLDAGAAGYMLKEGPGDELPGAIRKVMADQVYLSAELVSVVVGAMRRRAQPGAGKAAEAGGADEAGATLTARERELVQLLSEGYSTSGVAERLHVSVKTVATHREHVMHKLNLHSVAELTRYALREGLSSLDTPCGAASRPRDR